MRKTILLFFISIGLVSQAQELVTYKLSECDSDAYVDLVRRRIVSKTLKDDTLTLRVGFVENCCIEPQPLILSSNDTLFLSVKNNSDTYCACNCCFEIDLRIANISDTNFVVVWGQHALRVQSKYPKLPHEYQIDEHTPVGQVNSGGLKIGLWQEHHGSEGRRYEVYYDLHPIEKAKILWIRVYNNDNELEQISIRQGMYGGMIDFEPRQYAKYFEK